MQICNHSRHWHRKRVKFTWRLRKNVLSYKACKRFCQGSQALLKVHSWSKYTRRTSAVRQFIRRRKCNLWCTRCEASESSIPSTSSESYTNVKLLKARRDPSLHVLKSWANHNSNTKENSMSVQVTTSCRLRNCNPMSKLRCLSWPKLAQSCENKTLSMMEVHRSSTQSSFLIKMRT